MIENLQHFFMTSLHVRVVEARFIDVLIFFISLGFVRWIAFHLKVLLGFLIPSRRHAFTSRFNETKRSKFRDAAYRERKETGAGSPLHESEG